jgi:hypothetical protein
MIIMAMRLIIVGWAVLGERGEWRGRRIEEAGIPRALRTVSPCPRLSLSELNDVSSELLVVSLNARDEVLSAEYHKIRASQGTKVPWMSRGYSKEDARLKAACIARLVAWWASRWPHKIARDESYYILCPPSPICPSRALRDTTELFVVFRLCEETRYTTQAFLILIAYWVSFPESDALEQRFEHYTGMAKIRGFLLPFPMQRLITETRASIMASATPFFFCTTQKHLTVKSI